MPSDPSPLPSSSSPGARAPGYALPLTRGVPPTVAAPRARLLRWLVRLRAVLWVSALLAIAVYFVRGMEPRVRLVAFMIYGLMALSYVGLYFYVLATRVPKV